MVLIDLNQVILASLLIQITKDKTLTVNDDLIRHITLNILRGHINKFKREYGEVVLCCDNKKYWRKEFFPFYKAGRKKNRDKSALNWALIFDSLATIKNELKEVFPYKVIDVDGAEADDIIGTLVPRFCDQKILIISSDNDFLQLQKYKNVKQYNPVEKKFLISENPHSELRQKIICGDFGDGIPNILSPSDTFVRNVRQKAMTKLRLSSLMEMDMTDSSIDPTIVHNWCRNRQLIDLDYIPINIKTSIIDTYENAKPPNKMKLFNYFVEKKLKNLMDVLDEF